MINSYAQQLGSARSCIRELFAYGQTLANEQGAEAVCDFSLGNPATPPPNGVQEALAHLIATEDPMAVHGYTTAEGALATREVIAASLKQRYGFEVTAKDLFLTAGAAPALTAVFAALTIDEDTEFVAIAPYFPEYKVFSHVWGACLTVVPAKEPDFQIDMAALEGCIGPHTQGVIVNSPNNPSGVVYTKETLEALGEVLTRLSKTYGHPIYLISDEPYRELVYDGKEVPFLPSIYPNTVVCYSYSKSLSLPGDRIGYVLVSPFAWEAEALRFGVAGAARSIGHVCAPATYQKLVAVCEGEMPNLAFYDHNRKMLYEGLTALGYECVYPDGAFYLFVKAPGGDAAAFSRKAKELGLLVVPCGDFGCPGYIRVAYCVATEVIERAMPLFEQLVK